MVVISISLSSTETPLAIQIIGAPPLLRNVAKTTPAPEQHACDTRRRTRAGVDLTVIDQQKSGSIEYMQKRLW